MQLTKRFIIKPQPELIRLCKVSNDLYNQSLYHWRQRRDDDGVFLTEFQLRREMRDVPNLDGEYNYRLLKARMADQTIKEVHLAIMTFFNAMKDWKQHPEKYKAMPAFPRYHKSGGLTMIQIDSQYFRIRNGRIIYDRGKNLGIDIPQYDVWRERLESAKILRVRPMRTFMIVEIVYEQDCIRADVSPDRVAALDLGIDNLCTVVSPCGCTIYNGRQLKSFNQGCNKEIAKAKSILMQQQPDIKNANSKRLRAMYDRRNRFMETFMHTLSRQIVNQLIGEHVGVLVVGFNKGWKQNTGMNKIQNQKFAYIPFFQLQSKLRYKCQMAGIEYVEQEEGYTSKCDALGMEVIGFHDNYAGRRQHRGLFVSSTGKAVNADMNGALNILRKHLGDECYQQLTADWPLTKPPVRVNVI